MGNNSIDLEGVAGDRHFKTLSVFGLSTEAVAGRLKGGEFSYPDVRFVVESEEPIIRVKIYARRSLEPGTDVMRWACDCLGNAVFSDSGKDMEQVVGSLLLEKKASLALAESCTGGLIANLLTDVPGSSDYFQFSAVTYSNQAKIKVLNVETRTLKRYGAVSEQTAIEMAMGARQATEADYGLATSGIAGPAGGSDDKPVGTVCIGLASRSEATGHRFHIKDRGRRTNKRIFALAALNLLRQKLLDA